MRPKDKPTKGRDDSGNSADNPSDQPAQTYVLPPVTEEDRQAIRDLLGPLAELSRLGIPVAPMEEDEEPYDPEFEAWLKSVTVTPQPPARMRYGHRRRRPG